MVDKVELTLPNGDVVTEEDLRNFGENLCKSLTNTRELLKVADEQNKKLRGLLDSHDIPYSIL